MELDRLVGSHQVVETLPKVATLVREREGLLTGKTRAEVLAEFIEHAAKASSTGKTTEAAHRVVALFDRTVVLLQAVVQVLTGP